MNTKETHTIELSHEARLGLVKFLATYYKPIQKEEGDFRYLTKLRQEVVDSLRSQP